MTLLQKLDKLESVVKHMPGRHNQRSHTPKIYLSHSVARSDISLDYVDAKAMEYVSTNVYHSSDPRTPDGYANIMRLSEGLIEGTDLSAERTAVLMQDFGISSNRGPYALGLQGAISQEFDVALGDYQQWLVDRLGKIDDKYDLVQQGIANVPRYNAARNDGAKIVRTMYENTQRELAAAGIDKLVLYRGVYYPSGTKEESAAARMETGDITAITMNSSESWSADPNIAQGFSRGAGDSGVGLVLQMEVPASRVLSTHRTGFGWAKESEFVLLGNNTGDEARIVGISGGDA